MPNFRPRISILTALLLMTILAMAIVVAQQWREVGPLRSEVRRLRDELGQLSIEDPTKLHAIEVRTKDAMIWKWRIWVPERMNAQLRFAWSDVPLDGYPAADVAEKDNLKPGEQWISVTVQKAPGIDNWQCALEFQDSKIIWPIPRDRLWFLQRRYSRCAGGVSTSSESDDVEDGRNTFLLRRERVQLEHKPVDAMDDPEKLPGFMLWLEAR